MDDAPEDCGGKQDDEPGFGEPEGTVPVFGVAALPDADAGGVAFGKLPGVGIQLDFVILGGGLAAY